jgi:hypothetical protein
MITRSCRFRLLLTAAVLVASLGAAHAAFVPVDDFENLPLGPIDGLNDWRAPSIDSAVALDPADPANHVLSVVTNSTFLHHPAFIADGTTRMLFLRFRYEEQLNFSFGMSGSTYPTQFGDFDAELSMTNATNELRINNDGQYEVLTSLAPATWYNCWLLIDDANDGTTIWLHDRDGDPATAADQLASDGQTFFAFRDRSSGDLRTFFIKTGGGNGLIGPLLIDDIQLEDTGAVNLDNPTAVVAAVGATPPVIASLDAHPNPFNPQTQICCSLTEPRHLTLTIHDLAGRVVAVLVDGDCAAGPHSWTWRGRDGGGSPVPSGTYVARLAAPSTVQAVKLTLVQ